MVGKSRSSAAWKVISLSGIVLLVVGIGAGYLDDATHFKFEFISDSYDIFGTGILAGVVLTFIGLIGWARHRDKQGRLRMAALVFVSPWIVLLLGYPIAGINLHDYSGEVSC